MAASIAARSPPDGTSLLAAGPRRLAARRALPSRYMGFLRERGRPTLAALPAARRGTGPTARGGGRNGPLGRQSFAEGGQPVLAHRQPQVALQEDRRPTLGLG